MVRDPILGWIFFQERGGLGLDCLEVHIEVTFWNYVTGVYIAVVPLNIKQLFAYFLIYCSFFSSLISATLVIRHD